MTSIRTYTATPADIAEILDLGQQMHAESAFRHFDIDIPKCAMLIHTCLTNPDTHFIRVAVGPTNEIVGMLLGYISEYYFGRDLIASDYLWYVTPEYRGSRAAVLLLRDFQKWAEERNASEVHMGLSTGVHAEKVGALLENLGYDLVGGNYKLRVVV
jgi:hypothetical protein